jgi:hypothetical protein
MPRLPEPIGNDRPLDSGELMSSIRLVPSPLTMAVAVAVLLGRLMALP